MHGPVLFDRNNSDSDLRAPFKRRGDVCNTMNHRAELGTAQRGNSHVPGRLTRLICFSRRVPLFVLALDRASKKDEGTVVCVCPTLASSLFSLALSGHVRAPRPSRDFLLGLLPPHRAGPRPHLCDVMMKDPTSSSNLTNLVPGHRSFAFTDKTMQED